MEVLIAILVLSVGLLGLAQIQNQGLRFNHDAYYLTQANFLANDMVERMRTSILTQNVENSSDVNDYASTSAGVQGSRPKAHDSRSS